MRQEQNRHMTPRGGLNSAEEILVAKCKGKKNLELGINRYGEIFEEKTYLLHLKLLGIKACRNVWFHGCAAIQVNSRYFSSGSNSARFQDPPIWRIPIEGQSYDCRLN